LISGSGWRRAFTRVRRTCAISTVVESIIERFGTPYFSFKDIDENTPDRLDQDPRRDISLLPGSSRF
jgi:hypothetical protein